MRDLQSVIEFWFSDSVLFQGWIGITILHYQIWISEIDRIWISEIDPYPPNSHMFNLCNWCQFVPSSPCPFHASLKRSKDNWTRLVSKQSKGIVSSLPFLEQRKVKVINQGQQQQQKVTRSNGLRLEMTFDIVFMFACAFDICILNVCLFVSI